MCDSHSHITPHSVHTLAQLSTPSPYVSDSKGGEGIGNDQKNLQKRARAKTLTNRVLMPLVDLDSPLNKSYWRTWHCSNIILQEGTKITSKYCNARWCMVCNRIRTAKSINGYKDPISRMKEPYFVTLTIENCKARDLKKTIEGMVESFTRIRKNIKKSHGIKLVGMRKTECTYNPTRDDYHPHYHCLIESKEAGEKLVEMWMAQYPNKTDIKGQDCKPAKQGTEVELFKYFTKVINDDRFYPKQMDIIFRAMHRKRVLQPMGLKKVVSEDVDEIQGQEIDFKPPQQEIYGFEDGATDWVTADGEVLTGYRPTQNFNNYLDKVYDKKSYDRRIEQDNGEFEKY